MLKKIIKHLKNIDISFALLLFLALVTRFYKLDFQSFWNDELAAYAVSLEENAKQVLLRLKNKEPHPPLYWLFMHYYTLVFGHSEFVMRLPSAVFGFLSVALAYPLGKKLFNKNIALFASVFIALNTKFIFLSQQAKSNSMLLFFSLASFYFFYNQFFSKRKNKQEIIRDENTYKYEIVSLICAYVHYAGLFQIITQGVLALIFSIKNKKLLKKTISVYSFIFVFFLPQFFIMIFQNSHAFVTYGSVDFVILKGFFEFYFGANLLLLLGVWAFFSSFFYISYKGVKYFIKKKKIKLDELFMVYFLAFFPILILALVSVFSTSIFVPRNYMPASFFMLLITGFFIDKYIIKIKKSLIYILIIFKLINLNYAYDFYKTPLTTNYRKAIKYLAENYKKEQSLVFCAYEKEFYSYYQKHFSSPKEKIDCYNQNWREENYENYIIQQINKKNKHKKNYGLWVVETERKLSDKMNNILDKEYKLKTKRIFPNHFGDWKDKIIIRLFEKKSSG